MTLRTLLFCIVALVSHSAYSASLDLNLHSKAFRATYAFVPSKDTVTDLGVLFLQDDHGDDSETAFHAGLNFVFENFRFGGRAFYVSPGNSDVLAVGLGGQARFAVTKKVGVGAHIYYAPEFTSMMDSKGYQEMAVHVDFRVVGGAYVYLGYRNLKVSIGNANHKIELDDDPHLGIKFYF